VRDLAYARLQSPDLDAQEEFLTAFGMVRAARTPTALYMRGTDPSHHIHVTKRGEPKFIGFAWAVSNEDELVTISKMPGASGIETIDEPGGGKRVRLTEPNGYTIEIVYGVEAVQPIQVERQPINSGVAPLNRAGEVIRFAAGPSSVKRIGHAPSSAPRRTRRPSAGSAKPSVWYARTTFMPGTKRTSLVSSVGSMPATIMLITTPSSA
jgi:hypothetical protein